MFKRILWATDFSEHARRAGQTALQCAQCNKGDLYAITVVDPDDLPVILDDVPDPFISPDKLEDLDNRLEKQYEQHVQKHLKREIQALGETLKPVISIMCVGTPWKEIIRYAGDLEADLIVIGSHGKRSLEQILFGNTVENVTKHASCPVLVMR